MTRCKIHKYKRVKLPRNQNIVYKCVRCPHYVIEPLVLGRECECWYCGSTFQMNPKSLLLKPHCGCRSKDDSNLPNSKKRTKESLKIPDNTRNELVDFLLSKTMGKSRDDF